MLLMLGRYLFKGGLKIYIVGVFAHRFVLCNKHFLRIEGFFKRLKLFCCQIWHEYFLSAAGKCGSCENFIQKKAYVIVGIFLDLSVLLPLFYISIHNKSDFLHHPPQRLPKALSRYPPMSKSKKPALNHTACRPL